MRSIALAQDAARRRPVKPFACRHGRSRARGRPKSEMDITREQIVPSLGATRYTVGPDDSIHNRRAKTRRL